MVPSAPHSGNFLGRQRPSLVAPHCSDLKIAILAASFYLHSAHADFEQRVVEFIQIAEDLILTFHLTGKEKHHLSWPASGSGRHIAKSG
jgi:hypothetical protein